MTGHMTEAEFDRHWPQIASDVRTIRAADNKSRNRFRVLALYEVKTAEMIAEVLHTHHGPVVVYRSHSHELSRSAGGFKAFQRQNGLTVEPLTGDPDQTLHIWAGSGSGRYQVMGADLARYLTEGVVRFDFHTTDELTIKRGRASHRD